MDGRGVNETMHQHSHPHPRRLRECYPPEGGTGSKGYWYGDDPFKYSTPLLMVQITLFFFINRSLRALLKPLGQPTIVSDILAGMILGPVVLGRISPFADKIFPYEGQIILETFAPFGYIFFQMLIGVRMDIRLVSSLGRMPVAIGIFCYVLPFIFGGAVCLFLPSPSMSTGIDIATLLTFAVTAQSMSALPVITCFLRDLKILNSELGRLATSSSLVCDLCTALTFVFVRVFKGMKRKRPTPLFVGSVVSVLTLVLIIVFVLRPIALWVIRQTPAGKPVKESYIVGFMVALVGCALVSEVIGHGYIMVPFVMGLVIPDGPPLGTALEDRVDTFVSIVLMPIFFTLCGLKTNWFTITELHNLWIVQLVILVCFLGKIIGVMLPSLFFKMPFRDGFTLALVMTSKGVSELALLKCLMEDGIIEDQTFSILIVSLVITTSIVSYLVRTLYDPYTRYLPYKRTIQQSKRNTGVSILACVHNTGNIPTIIKILEASNPYQKIPIHIPVLHLIELVGRYAALLITHQRHNIPSFSTPSESEHIVNAFRYHEKKSHGHILVDVFTSISPWDEMHDDVCSLALAKKTAFIIMPFHKQWLASGEINSIAAIRTLNYNVLKTAPCSVGILIDRRFLSTSQFFSQGTHLYSIAVLFIGGADDREALSYAKRMAYQENVTLTVIQFISKDVECEDSRMNSLDGDVLSEFLVSTLHNKRVFFKEEEVIDGQGVVNAIRSMETGDFNLVMVGRRHIESSLTSGLAEWTEYPELGTIGDILAALESEYSVMVVQQQRGDELPATLATNLNSTQKSNTFQNV